jgi:hypothetical protein
MGTYIKVKTKEKKACRKCSKEIDTSDIRVWDPEQVKICVQF